MLNTGTKVLIKKHRTVNMHSGGYMDKYLSKIMTIRRPYDVNNTYSMHEDKYDSQAARSCGGCSMVEDNRDWYWIESDFEKEVIV